MASQIEPCFYAPYTFVKSVDSTMDESHIRMKICHLRFDATHALRQSEQVLANRGCITPKCFEVLQYEVADVFGHDGFHSGIVTISANSLLFEALSRQMCARTREPTRRERSTAGTDSGGQSRSISFNFGIKDFCHASADRFVGRTASVMSCPSGDGSITMWLVSTP
jgi:hypothetical protein